MSVAQRQKMTLEAFLAWEERQEDRHEFDGFQPVGMTGGTLAHARIQRNLAIAVGSRLRGGPCEFLGSDIKLMTGHTVRYPDGMVTRRAGADDSTVAPEPVVIFEVLSRITASTDHITKNREYAALPGVRRYVMLEQERVGATVFARVEGEWRGAVLAGGAILSMPEIGVELPLDELYEGLDLSGADADAGAAPGS